MEQKMTIRWREAIVFRTTTTCTVPDQFIDHDVCRHARFISALLHLVNGRRIKRTIRELSVNGLATHDRFVTCLALE